MGFEFGSEASQVGLLLVDVENERDTIWVSEPGDCDDCRFVEAASFDIEGDWNEAYTEGGTRNRLELGGLFPDFRIMRPYQKKRLRNHS